LNKDDILEVLRHVYDPDYQDRSIVEMGLVSAEDVDVRDDRVEVSYDVTAPLCPFSAAIGVMIKYALKNKLGLDARVKMKSGHLQEDVVNQTLIAEPEHQELLEKLKTYGVLDRCVRI